MSAAEGAEPAPGEDESVLELRAGTPEAVLAYGTAGDQVIELRGASARPLVAIVHGGFWRPAFDRAHTGALAEAMVASGLAVATIEYRRIPGDPDATVADVMDALAALAQVSERAPLLLGHSAGGHLALLAAARGARMRGVVAIAPVADLVMAERLGLGGGAVPAFLGRPAAERPDLDPARLPALPPAAIPVRIVQGLDDRIVPPAVARSFAAGHPGALLEEVEAAGHFALIDPRHPAGAAVVADLAAHLNTR